MRTLIFLMCLCFGLLVQAQESKETITKAASRGTGIQQLGTGYRHAPVNPYTHPCKSCCIPLRHITIPFRP